MTDSRTVLAVVVFLGLFALVGLAGLVWLVHDGTEAAGVAIIGGPVATALGALGALLASTRSSDPAQVAATARTEAIADVASLTGNGTGETPTVVEAPALVVGAGDPLPDGL